MDLDAIFAQESSYEAGKASGREEVLEAFWRVLSQTLEPGAAQAIYAAIIREMDCG